MAAAFEVKWYFRFTPGGGRLGRFLPLGTPNFKRTPSAQLAPVVGETFGIRNVKSRFPPDVSDS